MSDLPSDLRRLQEQLTPEPWFHNGLQTDDLSDDYRLANAIFNTDGGGDPIPHDKELKLLRRPEPGEPKEADAETSNANLRAIVELRNLLPRILTALAPAVKPLVWVELPSGDAWYAVTPFANYTIGWQGSRFKWHVCFDEDHDEHEGEAPTLEAAQAAAWAHWSERIGGAIQ